MISHTCKHNHFYRHVNWRDIKSSFDSDIIKYVLRDPEYTIHSGNNLISIEWNIGMDSKYTYQFVNFDIFKSLFDNYETVQFCFFCEYIRQTGSMED